jgi:hypothetical protein
MKVEVKYSFVGGSSLPYRATAWVGTTCIAGVSEFSFDEAKEDLLKDVKKLVEIKLPEPEEVEI